MKPWLKLSVLAFLIASVSSCVVEERGGGRARGPEHRGRGHAYGHEHRR